MGSKVRFAVVNADANRSLARRFAIRMLPAIKYYDAGYGKTDESAKEYTDSRSAEDLLSFANKLRKKYDDDPSQYVYVPNKNNIVQDLEPKEPEVVDSVKESIDNPDKSAVPDDEEEVEE